MDIERVYFKHYRYRKNATVELVKDVDKLTHYTKGKTKWEPTCKGGRTECHLVLSDGQEIIGESECSIKDNFIYTLGRSIAYGRALKAYIQMYEYIPF